MKEEKILENSDNDFIKKMIDIEKKAIQEDPELAEILTEEDLEKEIIPEEE